ncbi:CopG family transcriptional regulator [Agrococcus sp. ARC_14]|uniref:CopG family transcriptional regulator n=1 Tax=Agrococcus sp. ARC_14 TaxID=2919927 RepID=UPI001F05131B|nr:CopG family transcriptional regulator [Agrococcus sp. ARC_14]MCH1883213.1 CopG family transcriptional regulator [Agrococcus sp. ARC_14]
MAMTLRLSDADDDALEALAAATRVSKHEAALRAIRDAAAREGHSTAVAELSASARERYADLLDRLGR